MYNIQLCYDELVQNTLYLKAELSYFKQNKTISLLRKKIIKMNKISL